METVRAFFELLNSRERRRLYLLFIAVIVMAGLEVVSVASIMPFLSVAADPSSVKESYYLSLVYESFGFRSTNTFLVVLGFAALAALVVSNAFIVFTAWALQRFVWGLNHTLSSRLLRRYLRRPYQNLVTRNSTELGKNVLEEVKEVTNGMLNPALLGAAKSIVSIFIIGFLVVIDPVVAGIVSIVLGMAYTIIYYGMQGYLDWSGSERVKSNTKRYQFVRESFSGMKEVKVHEKEEDLIKRYKNPSKRYAQVQALYRLLKKAPRYILEAVAFGGIILIAVYLISVRDDMEQVIPVLGLYAFAGYRLLPALQSAFSGLASASYNTAALESLRRGLRPQANAQSYDSINGSHGIEGTLKLDDRILLKNVRFTYPGAEEPAIKNLSLKIPAHSTVGFVGKTGSGKTTTVDLVLGLLRPQQGNIFIDDIPLQGDYIRKWRRNIGYVPQQIYLADDTVARNIAFGESGNEVNIDQVKKAAKQACIYSFIEGLEDRWYTKVGEEGVRLSGGQRQRIGIARALYRDPSVLVFDEATSDLDQATEEKVMQSIYKLETNQTILIIAHNIDTVKTSDIIVVLEDGKKVGEGRYADLSRQNSKFMAIS